MNYFLRTLEGVTTGSSYNYNEFLDAVRYRRLELGASAKDAMRDELLAVYENLGNGIYTNIKNQLLANYGMGNEVANFAITYVEDLIEYEAELEKIRQMRVAELQAKQQVEAQANEIINEDIAVEEEHTDEPAQDASNEPPAETGDEEMTIENQTITSLPDYTVIDEDETSITYEDEAGEIHIEQKAKSDTSLWVIAAAAAVLFLT